MKIAVIGGGKVGSNLAQQLVREGHDVTIVDNDPANIKRIQNTADVLCVEGNGASVEVQKAAGVGKTDMLIATTPNDAVLSVCEKAGR